MRALINKKGYTFVEIIVSALILSFLIATAVQYHASSKASRGQECYLKAVQTAKSELDKLRALFKFDTDGDFAEFTETSPPPNQVFLYKVNSPTSIDLSSSLYRVYYDDHSSKYSGNSFLKPLGDSSPYAVNGGNTVDSFHTYYEEQFSILTQTDDVDRKTFTYFTYDSGTDQTDSDAASGKVDTALAVIDDMATPSDSSDDLLGNIGWWVENVDDNGYCKKITFALQFWYPGMDRTIDPEVIVLKTTLVRD